MSTQKSLRLPCRFEPSHHPLSHSGRLMGLLGPIVRVLGIIMNNIRHQFTVSNTVATQLVGHYLPSSLAHYHVTGATS